MTDADLVAKKLARIETCVAELRTLARPDEIRQDVRGYETVDLGILQEVVAHRLGDLLAFVNAIRRRPAAPGQNDEG